MYLLSCNDGESEAGKLTGSVTSIHRWLIRQINSLWVVKATKLLSLKVYVDWSCSWTSNRVKTQVRRKEKILAVRISTQENFLHEADLYYRHMDLSPWLISVNFWQAFCNFQLLNAVLKIVLCIFKPCLGSCVKSILWIDYVVQSGK